MIHTLLANKGITDHALGLPARRAAGSGVSPEVGELLSSIVSRPSETRAWPLPLLSGRRGGVVADQRPSS